MSPSGSGPGGQFITPLEQCLISCRFRGGLPVLLYQVSLLVQSDARLFCVPVGSHGLASTGTAYGVSPVIRMCCPGTVTPIDIRVKPLMFCSQLGLQGWARESFGLNGQEPITVEGDQDAPAALLIKGQVFVCTASLFASHLQSERVQLSSPSDDFLTE